jgi:hypothetical protein
VTKKPESSKGQTKGEKTPHSQREDVRESADFEHSAVDPLLAAGGSDPDKLASMLDKSDKVTQERLVGRLGQKHGNLFVQRMLAQRQTAEEHTGEQTDEESTAQHTPEEWAAFASAAEAGAQMGMTIFQAAAHMTGVIINGPVAQGGRLIGPSIQPHVFNQVLGAGASPQVALAFGNAAGRAWKRWVSRVSIPGLPLYPSFAAFPGGMAPPTPNVPVPLLAIAPGAMIDSGTVSAFIVGALREMANEPGAEEAASSFGSSLSTSFLMWIAGKLLSNLFGKGMVPSFAPPYVPAGPVVMGDVLPTPGIIN